MKLNQILCFGLLLGLALHVHAAPPRYFILADHPLAVTRRPSPVGRQSSSQVRFRKAAERLQPFPCRSQLVLTLERDDEWVAEKRVHLSVGLAQFADRQGPDLELDVSAGQRVATLPVQVLSPTPGDEKLVVVSELVVRALEIVLPVSILLNLVKHDQRLGRILSRQPRKERRMLDQLRLMTRNVPIAIEVIPKLVGDESCKGGLARLTRPREENHGLISSEGVPDTEVELPLFHLTIIAY